MRTTLKRGIGRGAEVNGNGYAVVPPGVLTPMTRYRQPVPARRTKWYWVGRILLYALSATLMAAGALAGGHYLWVHDADVATGARTPEQKRATRSLAPVPPPNRPAIALVVGYDHRLGANTEGPSRSDTLMLLRTD